MARDLSLKQINGHAFNDGRCERCDMTRKDFDDRGRPVCTGKKDPHQRHGRIPIPD